MSTWLTSPWSQEKKRPKGLRRPVLERLEKRELLAGNVVAVFSGGGLILTGDDLGNGVQISQQGRNYVVSGFTWQGAPTTINGRSSVVFSSLGTNLSVDLRSGNDALAITNATVTERVLTSPTSASFSRVARVSIPRDVNVLGGEGNDILLLGGVNVGRDANLNGGNGSDHIFLASTTVGDDLALNGGAGDDRFTVTTSSVRDSLSLVDGDGGHRVTLASVSAGATDLNLGGGQSSLVSISDFASSGILSLMTGFGNDQINLTRISAGNLTVDTGSSNDGIAISTMSIAGNATLNTRDGSDTILIRGNSNRVGANLSIDGGSGNDVVSVASLSVGQNFTVLVGSGFDQVSLSSVQVARNATIDTGSGTDTVVINAVSADTLFAQLGSGDRDFLAISNSSAKRAVLDGGAGVADKYEDRRGNRFAILSSSNFEQVTRSPF